MRALQAGWCGQGCSGSAAADVCRWAACRVQVCLWPIAMCVLLQGRGRCWMAGVSRSRQPCVGCRAGERRAVIKTFQDLCVWCGQGAGSASMQARRTPNAAAAALHRGPAHPGGACGLRACVCVVRAATAAAAAAPFDSCALPVVDGRLCCVFGTGLAVRAVLSERCFLCLIIAGRGVRCPQARARMYSLKVLQAACCSPTRTRPHHAVIHLLSANECAGAPDAEQLCSSPHQALLKRAVSRVSRS